MAGHIRHCGAGMIVFCMGVSWLFPGCGSQKSFVNTATVPDTYQCTYMKEVCKEAQEFERQFRRLTKEEKTEFRNLLHTYRSQCNDAVMACSESSELPAADSTSSESLQP